MYALLLGLTVAIPSAQALPDQQCSGKYTNEYRWSYVYYESVDQHAMYTDCGSGWRRSGGSADTGICNGGPY